MTAVYRVCIPHTSRDFFDYTAPDFNPPVGARVLVPFRQQQRLGIVVGQSFEKHAPHKLKAIAAVIDEKPLLPSDILSLCQWVSSYYQSSLSEVIPLVLPKKYRRNATFVRQENIYYELAVTPEAALLKLPLRAKRQRDLVNFLTKATAFVAKKTIVQAGFKSMQLKALLDLGIVSICKPPVEKSAPFKSAPLNLNPEQKAAVEAVSPFLNTYRCFLLQGVTGSGKTEVYLQILTQVLAKGQQVLVLVPEIGLTPQLLARFQARIPEPIVVIHSHLNESERQLAWQLASEAKARLVIGTRTAIFTPMPMLGLIIIDEEHDLSFKQMEGVRYSARDTALIRARAVNIPVILGSATPSIESLYNCTQSKYTLLKLQQKALTTTPLHYQLLDLRNQSMQHGLAKPALALIQKHLQQQNQVLVFINRRGYAPVLLCHACGWMAGCRACDSHLTYHLHLKQLICHHCGRADGIPKYCASCKSHELITVGAGTERVFEFLKEQFSSAAIVRIDRDTIRKKKALDDSLSQIHEGKAQLIVGTQMLAKGHHFPGLTLVVVLDVDQGFYNQDFRALERLGQLLTQVSGRAGRAALAGHVLIQTHLPDHPLLNILVQDGYEAFVKVLLEKRRQAQLPPFNFLALIRAQGKSHDKVRHFLMAVKDALQKADILVMGPAPAPLLRKNEYYRMQLLVKDTSRSKLHAALTAVRGWLTMNKMSNGIRWNVDVDPMDLS